MPALIIINEFSHMGGQEFIQQRFPKLAKEIDKRYYYKSSYKSKIKKKK